MAKLERSLSLFQATIYGVGIIVGAGIYALIGVAAGISGPALWLSFLVAAIIAGLSAFSYAELSSRFPKEGAEIVFMREAFKSRTLAFFVGYIALVSTLLSPAAVAWGFATYFKFFFNISSLTFFGVEFPFAVIVVVTIIALLSIVNFLGIQKSAILNTIFTVISLVGLIILIVFGLPKIGSVDILVGINGEQGLALITPIFSAAALIFFAYLGFEDIVNISEEIKGAKKNVAKALLIALVLSTIIYVLVSIIAVSAVPAAQLASAANPNVPLDMGPLSLVGESVVGPGFGFWMTIFALCATASTMLVLLVTQSRFIYAFAAEKYFPKFLSKIDDRTSTPFNAIIVGAIITLVLAFFGGLESLGSLTTMGVFLMFFFINLALIVVRFDKHQKEGGFRSPINIGKLPVLAVLSALFCLFMFLTQFWGTIKLVGIELPLIVFGILFYLTGLPVYHFFNRVEKDLTDFA